MVDPQQWLIFSLILSTFSNISQFMLSNILNDIDRMVRGSSKILYDLNCIPFLSSHIAKVNFTFYLFGDNKIRYQ